MSLKTKREEGKESRCGQHRTSAAYKKVFAFVHGTKLSSAMKCIRPTTGAVNPADTSECIGRLAHTRVRDTTLQGCGTIPFWNPVKVFWKRE